MHNLGDAMNTSPTNKSSIEEIRKRFDADVERFSNLESGQAATIDAPLAMELITQAAVAATPVIERCLDIGCGAGNNTIRLIQTHGGDFDCDLCDLSEPMLKRAQERVAAHTQGTIRAYRGDFRTIDFAASGYDLILAAAVLHHLRDDRDWRNAFAKLHALLRPGGSLWITDLVAHEYGPIDRLMWRRYADYLIETGGPEHQQQVFAWIEKEDSPRSVIYQLDLLRDVGFQQVELLHKHSCFAAFGAVKGRSRDD